MTQPAANNPRKRREKPTKHLSACWIDAGVYDRMKAHIDAAGLVQTKFIERAIAAQLDREQTQKPDADS